MPINVTMPALSPTMTEGTLAKWYKKVGDDISSGDIIAEIETDKATMEVEAVEEGKLVKILVEGGTEGVPVNTPIAIILEEGEDLSSLDSDEATVSDEATIPSVLSHSQETSNSKASQPEAKKLYSDDDTLTDNLEQSSNQKKMENKRIIASPLARRMAKQANLDLSEINGSGPNGRIVKTDIEKLLSQETPENNNIVSKTEKDFVSNSLPALVSEGSFTDEPVSMIRKVIAERLTSSKKSIPHFYLTVECEIDALLEMRKQLNERAPQGDNSYKLSVNDFIIRATALSLGKFKNVNASWNNDFIRKYHRVDISIAIATKTGLITPVVRDANNKGLAQISNLVKDFSTRAQNGKLLPEEYQGGGFTISNLGMYDVKEFSAIINPPQSAILAVSTGKQCPVVKNDALSIATMMNCTLSADHRVIDGAVGAEFMAEFKSLIEEPLTMML